MQTLVAPKLPVIVLLRKHAVYASSLPSGNARIGQCLTVSTDIDGMPASLRALIHNEGNSLWERPDRHLIRI